MKLGISTPLKHKTPKEWAETMRRIGCGSVVFPVDYTYGEGITEYEQAAKDKDLLIAEVGVWCNPISPNKKVREEALLRCKEQLKLADRIGAKCCVNVAGSMGAEWDGGYQENFTQETWDITVKSIQEIIDAVEPRNTFYTIEPMPWMIPMDPDQYLRLIKDVNRKQFAVHLDFFNWITSPQKYFFHEQFMEECFAKLGDYIKSCHIKDVCLRKELTFQLKETSCGDGTINLEKYAKAATEIDRDMPMIIEHLHTDSEYLESLEYLRRRMLKSGIELT